MCLIVYKLPSLPHNQLSVQLSWDDLQLSISTSTHYIQMQMQYWSQVKEGLVNRAWSHFQCKQTDWLLKSQAYCKVCIWNLNLLCRSRGILKFLWNLVELVLIFLYLLAERSSLLVFVINLLRLSTAPKVRLKIGTQKCFKAYAITADVKIEYQAHIHCHRRFA